MIEANYYPPNGYPYTTCKDLRGTSDDTKPSDVSEGSTFHEWDTGNEYMFDGSDWLLQTSGGGGGGGGGFGAITALGVSDNTTAGGGDPIPFYISEIKGVIKAEAFGSFANILVSDGVTSLAAGAEISILWANSKSYATTDNLILYDFDLDTQGMTPLPDTVTPILSPNITGCTFTMPAAEDGHFIMLSVEESQE